MQRTVDQTTDQAIAAALEPGIRPGLYRDIAAELGVGPHQVLAVAGHLVHQMIAPGVACDLPRDQVEYSVPDGFGSAGPQLGHMPGTCPDCMEIPVKISRGAGSPMVKIFPTGV